jgi:PAS domain S-box-containing protein
MRVPVTNNSFQMNLRPKSFQNILPDQKTVLSDNSSKIASSTPSAAGNIGLWEINVELDKVSWSRESSLIHGIDSSTTISIETLIGFYHPDDQALIENSIRRALGSDESFQIDLRVVDTGKATRHIRSTGAVRQATEDQPKTVFGFCQDISAEIRRNDDFLASQELLKQAEILNTTGHWIFNVASGDLFWSDGMYHLHGLEVGSPINDKTALSFCHPEDKALILEHLKKPQRNDENYSYELRIIRNDGEVRYVKSVGGLRINADGSQKLMFGLLEDITEAKNTEITLSRSEAMFKSFIDHSPSAILVKTPDGNYQTANPTWHEWFNPDGLDIEGMSVRDFADANLAAEIEEHDRLVGKEGQSTEDRHVLPRSDRSDLNILTQKFPILDNEGGIVGIGSMNTDITELISAEETQTRLFEVLETISDGYVFYDSDQKLVYCNQRYREFYPWIDDVLVKGNSLYNITRTGAERIREVIGIEDIDAWVDQRLADFVQGSESHTRVLRDGRVLLCSDSRSADGGYVGTRTDITELKRAEAILQESGKRFQVLFDAAIISIWDEDFSVVIMELNSLRESGITDLDSWLRQNLDEAYRLAGLVKINDVNEATLTLYGVTSKPEFIDRLVEIMTDETIYVFIGVLNAIWNRESEFKTEASHKTFDGRDVTVYMSFPIPSSDTEWHHVPVCIFDITDQKKAETDLRVHQESLEKNVAARTRDLQASETKLRDLIDGSLQGIVVHDDMKPLFVNDTYADIFGYSIDEIMSFDSMLKTLAPGELEKITWYHEQRNSGQEVSERYQYKAVRKDGRTIWLENRARKVNWEGKLVTQSTIIDITEQKNAEEALAESEQLYRGILETSPISMGITDTKTGTARFVNDAHLKLLGVSREKFFETPGIEFWVDPKERAEFVEAYEKSGRAEGTIRLKRSDGTSIWAIQRWVKSPLDNGDVLFWLFDISNLKQAEEARAESERIYRSILESSPIGMGITSADTGESKFINDAQLKMLGVSRAKYSEKSQARFFHDPETRTRMIEKLHETGSANAEVWLKHIDGSTIWTIQKWVRSPQNERDFVFWATDITNLKETQTQLEEARDEAYKASQAKSDFLSSMSHELRTPLNAILGFGQLLQTSPDDPLSEDHQDSANRIMDGGRHLLTLVNDVLDLAKIESGSMTVTITEFSPLDVLEECLYFIAPSARERDIIIINDFSTTLLPAIFADDVRLKQVILNLLSNAIKYNRQGGTVTVMCEQTDSEMLRFAITDTGEGISADNQLKLFKPFSRLGAEHSNIEGTGIGLTVTRELLGLMGGTIGMQSVVGEGSTFWFELPLAKKES